MQNTRFRQQIIDKIQSYTDELNKEDFSHDFNHILRVEKLAKRIAEDENADMEIIEAASLMFDIARLLEDRGECEDHAVKGAEIARDILKEINFPKEKIESVCHAILAHRRSKDRIPETLEAKILQEADYLDAMGAIDIMRIASSSFTSNKYKRPVYLDEPYLEETAAYKSAVHFMMWKIRHPKHSLKNFTTRLGKQIAEDRIKFSQEYIDRFIDEWHGLR